MERCRPENELDQAKLEETIGYCLDRGVCFTVKGREQCLTVQEVARKLGFFPFLVHELEQGEEAFFIGPFGTILFGRVIEKQGSVAVWQGSGGNKTSRCCTVTSAIYRRVPRDLHDNYKVWARRWCIWPRPDNDFGF